MSNESTAGSDKNLTVTMMRQFSVSSSCLDCSVLLRFLRNVASVSAQDNILLWRWAKEAQQEFACLRLERASDMYEHSPKLGGGHHAQKCASTIKLCVCTHLLFVPHAFMVTTSLDNSPQCLLSRSRHFQQFHLRAPCNAQTHTMNDES